MLSPGVKYMLLATIFFSFMNVCVKLLPNIPAIEIVFFRALITLIISYIILKKRGVNIFGNNKKLLILRGLAGSGGLICYFITLQHMPLATAVTIQYLSPVFTSILAIFILKERLHWLQWLFFAMSFSGILVIQGFDERIENWLIIIGVVSAIFSGLAYNIIRKLKESDEPLVVVFYFPLVTIPLVAPVVAVQWVMPVGAEWLLLIGVGVFTQIAQVYLTRSYQLEAVGRVSILNYLSVVYALFIGYFIFNEIINIYSLIGIGLVVAGVILNIFFRQIRMISILKKKSD